MELVIKLKTELDFKSKYKTEICRNWTQGSCEFGEKCTFAHGHEELRHKENPGDNYRTKKCKQFHEQGFCQYGSRCQFKHIEEFAKGQDMSKAKTASCSPRNVEEEKRIDEEEEEKVEEGKKRLPVFVRLSQED